MHNYKIKIPRKSTIRIPTMQNDSRIVLIIATFKMNANDMISVLKGKTDKVKTKLTFNPKKSVTAGFVGLGFAGLGYSVIANDHNSIDNSLSSFTRALSLNSNDIAGHSLNNFQAVYDSVKDSGASLSMITDDGLSGLKTSLGLACAGVIGEVYPTSDEPVTKKPIDYGDGSNETTHKSGKSKAIVYLGFAAIGLGLAGYYLLKDGNFSLGDTTTEISDVNVEDVTGTDLNAGESTDSKQIYQNSDSPSDNGVSVDDASAVSTSETPDVEVIPEPIIEPITEPAETPWYVDKYGFEDADVGTYSNMFGEDIYAVKDTSLSGLSYNLFDTQTAQHILTHQEWTPSMIALHNELSPDQYKDLVAQYGDMESLTMETIDNDPTNAGMDKVAIHYEGSKDSCDFITDVDGTHGVIYYIKKGMYLNLI